MLGHPVPMFAWDFLEAFPNAKVILTVRAVDKWLDTIKTLGSWWTQRATYRDLICLLQPLVMGTELSATPTTRQLVRKYLENNAK